MNVATSYLILYIVVFLSGHTNGVKLRDKTVIITDAVLVSNTNLHATVDTTKADERTITLTLSENDWDSEENNSIDNPSIIAANDGNKAAHTVGRVRQRRLQTDFNLTGDGMIDTTQVNITMYLGEVISKCKNETMSFIDCKKLVLSNPLLAGARTIQTNTYKTQSDTFYNQVVIQIDYRGYVLGLAPDFNGMVYYPLEWNGNPDKGPGARAVGPWDCKGLKHVQCCSMIEGDVGDPDLAGNYLACWVEKASWYDRVRDLYQEVFLNPIDSTINNVGGQDELDAIEARERPVRDVLIQAIEDITFRTSVETTSVKQIYISCLFVLRGVKEPRPTFIVIRNLIRKAESSGLTEDWKTFDIVGNLPINEKKLLAFALTRIKDFLKVANKYPLDNNNGGEKYFFYTTTRANQAMNYTELSWYIHPWQPEPELIHRCVSQRIHSYDCDILLDGVKVVFVYHRLLSDTYYNQVHIGTGFDGVVSGVQPHLSGIVGYPLPLNPWRGMNNTRMIGPWNCRGLLAWDCCNRILSSVPDPDINGKYLDCWLGDTLITDEYTGKQSQVIYDKTIPSNVWPSVHPTTFEQIETIMAFEREVNTNLTRDIIIISKMTACSKTVLVDLVNRIRHATRGDPRAQGIPYTIMENIRAMGTVTILNVVNHQVLQFVFDQVTQMILAANTFARNGTTNWGDEGNLVILVNCETVHTVTSHGTPKTPFRYAINNPCPNGKFKYNECSHGCGAVFYTPEALKDALVSYAVNKTNGVESFGVVNNWDVGKISNMSKLFYNLLEFNDAIRCWNVSGATSMESMFSGASAFNQSLAIWDVENVINMEEMFSGCSSFDRPLSQWNTSKLMSSRAMFQTALSFNRDISTWNVAKLTSMERTFLGAASFNQPLANWNISRVTNMERAFLGASSFNQALATWNVSGVLSMAWMFQGAVAFNQPLESWDVRKVIAMAEMFYQAFSFNQNLATWNFGSLIAMDGMFREASSFKQNLCVWFDKNPDILLRNQPTVTSMFLQSACSFTSDPNFLTKETMCSNCKDSRPPTVQPTKYPTLKPTSITSCPRQDWRYSDCCGACGFVFTQNGDLKSAVALYDANKANGIASFGVINCWDVSLITGMSALFSSLSTFNEAIGCWDTSSAINMDGMFFSASSFNQPLTTWSIPNVMYMGAMFNGASVFNQDLCSWFDEITGVPEGSDVFQMSGCVNPANPNFLTKQTFCATCKEIPAPTKAPINAPQCSQDSWKFSACCGGCAAVFESTAELRDAVTAYDTDTANGVALYGVINCWDVSQVTEMDMLFMNLPTFNEVISCWDVSNVINMGGMFLDAWAFNQPLVTWNVPSVMQISQMFVGASSFNQDLCSWYDKITLAPEGSEVFSWSGCTELSDPNFTTKNFFCNSCDIPEITQCSQPNFKFNGCCDNCGAVFDTKEALQSAVTLYAQSKMDGIAAYVS